MQMLGGRAAGGMHALMHDSTPQREGEEPAPKRRRKKGPKDDDGKKAAEAARLAGASTIEQFQAQLEASGTVPNLVVPLQTQGVQWDRFVFHCQGCTLQNKVLYWGWAASPKSDWKREGQAKYENKARENLRRKTRLVNCGLQDDQLDSYKKQIAAYGCVFPAVVKLNDCFWEYLSKPSIQNGDIRPEKVTTLVAEMVGLEEGKHIWRIGEARPPLQVACLQELKLCYTSRMKPLSAQNMLLQMDASTCRVLMPDVATRKLPEDFPEFFAPVNRQDNMLRKFWTPGKFQYRLWVYAFKNMGQHSNLDVGALKDALFIFFRHIFKDELAGLKVEENTPAPGPAEDAAPAVKAAEPSDGAADEDDDDSNFDECNGLDEFELNAGADAAPDPSTKHEFIEAEANSDAKLVCACAWPDRFGIDVLRRLVSMVEPEAKVAQTPMVSALMTKSAAFKELAKIAVARYKLLQQFQDWCDKSTNTWASFEKFWFDTMALVTKPTSTPTAITAWSTTAKERKRFETFKKAVELLGERAADFKDKAILGAKLEAFEIRERKAWELVAGVPVLCKRLWSATIARTQAMATGAPVRSDLLVAMDSLVEQHMGQIGSLPQMNTIMVQDDPPVELRKRLHSLQEFFIIGTKLSKEHFTNFEPLVDNKGAEIPEALTTTYHDLCADFKTFSGALGRDGSLSWATGAIVNEIFGTEPGDSEEKADPGDTNKDDPLRYLKNNSLFFTAEDVKILKEIVGYPHVRLFYVIMQTFQSW